VGRQTLFTLSASALNPLPAATFLSRMAPAAASAAEQLQDALVGCLGEDATRLEESGVPFYVVPTGEGVPVVFGHAGELYFVGSNPDVVRGVIRRSQGSSEPSLADSELFERAKAALEPGGLSVSLDFLAAARTAESFGGMISQDPEADYLFHRVTAALRTLGGVAWHVTATPEGILSESIVAVNPGGGDEDLADLLLCSLCRVTRPALLPAGSVRVSGQVLPLRDLFRYVQGWLEGLSDITGEAMDLRGMLQSELGVDIDEALLDWVGGEVYAARLQPPSDRLSSLLYGDGQVLLVPVTDPATAQAGLDQLQAALGRLWRQALAEDSSGDLSGLPLEFVTRSYDYKGVEIERNQWGPTVDIGTTFVGGYLAVGRPARALEVLIDTAKGGPSLLGNPLPGNLPSRPLAFSYGDEGAILGGLAGLLGVASQPVAFALGAAAAEEAQQGPQQPGSRSEVPGMADVLHLTEILPKALGILAQHTGRSTGYTELRGQDIYSRHLTEVAW
ncbi:MAG TPA: hypothetical protein VF171_00155, partial [Trueperaceae bacterium]